MNSPVIGPRNEVASLLNFLNEHKNTIITVLLCHNLSTGEITEQYSQINNNEDIAYTSNPVKPETLSDMQEPPKFSIQEDEIWFPKTPKREGWVGPDPDKENTAYYFHNIA